MSIQNLEELKWPVLILGTAVAVYVSALFALRWHDWEALSLALDLAPGVTRSPEFRVDQDARYLIALELQRNIPAHELNCLLGEPAPQQRCAVAPAVDLQWTLSSGPSEVATGRSRNDTGVGSGRTVAWVLGQFDAAPETPYVLEVVSLTDGSALAPANPRIVVQIHPAEFRGYFVMARLLAIAAIGMTVLGCVWLVIRILRPVMTPGKA